MPPRNVDFGGTRRGGEMSLDLGRQPGVVVTDDVRLWDRRDIGRDEVDGGAECTVGLRLEGIKILLLHLFRWEVAVE